MTSTAPAHDLPPSPAGGAAGGVAALLAEALVHRGTATPFALAVFGPPGSGKSRLLAAAADAAEALAGAAGRAPGAGPFLGDVALARVSAAPGRPAAPALVGAALDALARRHAAFAEEAVHAGADPREAARLAEGRLDGLRRTLDEERQGLDELGARRARLTDAVLFDASGSRVDGFARAHRGAIEARLRAFGVPGPDPVRAYKELVRGAEAGGGARLALTARALWAYKGQGALLVLAALLAALGWGAAAGADRPAAVDEGLARLGDRLAPVADGLRAHLDLLGPVGQIAWALAALSLLLLAMRALRFVGPVLRGAALLRGDVADRRRHLDALLAHQTRRVDALAAEVEAAGRALEAAGRRAEGRAGLSDGGTAAARDLFGLRHGPEAAAESFFALVGAEVAREGEGRPGRVVVALDGLDALPPTELAAFLETAHRLLARPGFALLAALDRDDAAAALGEADPAGAAARLDRVFGLSYDLGAEATDAAALAGELFEPDGAAPETAAPGPDPARSALDRAHAPYEAMLVRALAPFTGGAPRAVGRFVASYRLGRADPRLAEAPPAGLAMLALGLALDGTGSGAELRRFDEEVAGGRAAVDRSSPFGRALAAAAGVVGADMAAEDVRRGLAVARSYGRRG